MKTKLMVLAAVLAWSALALGQYKNTLAVLEIKGGQGVNQQLLSLVNEYFSTAVGNKSEYYVVSGQALTTRLQELKDIQLATCTSVGCLAKVGKTLGVQKVLAGDIKMEGKTFMVTLRLIDVQGEALAATVTEKYSGDEARLVEQLDQYVVKLFANEKQTLEQTRKKEEERKAFMQKLASASSANTNQFQVLLGQRLLANKGILFNDFIKLNLKLKRHNFGVDFTNQTTRMLDEQTTDTTRMEEKVTFSGFGLVYGYEAIQLLDGFIRFTPGVTVGSYKYDYVKFIDKTDGSGVRELYIPKTINGIFGLMMGVDVGKQFKKHFGLSAYGQVKALFRQEILLLVDFGLKFSF